jgi:UrcA family protein
MQGRKTLTVIAALLSGMTLGHASASAQEPQFTVYGEALGVRSERVAFTDLNLASASGQRGLQHRVDGAIERVCDLDLGRDGLQDRGYYACADAARDAAAPQIAEAIATGKTSLGAAILVVGR